MTPYVRDPERPISSETFLAEEKRFAVKPAIVTCEFPGNTGVER
jgi:hypothetical protein